MKRIVILFCILYSSSIYCIAQELAPRFYWPSPIGTKVAVSGYSHVNGDVLLDPTIPLYELNSRINTFFLAYMQNFSLLEGRQMSLLNCRTPGEQQKESW